MGSKRQPYRRQTRVYFAQAKRGGLIKIGSTVDTDARLKLLSKLYGETIECLLDLEAGTRVGDVFIREHALHDHFRALRVNHDQRREGGTEWFLPTRELASFIESRGGYVNGHIEEW